MPKLAPAHLAAAALALFGLGLTVSAFFGAAFAELRLWGGLALLVAAMVTSGLQLLATGGSTGGEET